MTISALTDLAPRSFSLLAVVLACWVLMVALPTFTPIRNWLASPLLVNSSNARADACYVLAGGASIYERLAAAADLVQMNRVPVILLMKNDNLGAYSFKSKKSWSGTDWHMDYLAWCGIPASKVLLFDEVTGLFGTLQEARNVAILLPKDVKSLVVVSSAPHMRRTILAFRRSLPPSVEVIPFAATPFKHSYEMYHPIWLEYLKLLVYYVVA